MALKKYNIDCSKIDNIKDLALLLNSLGLTYTRDTERNDRTFEYFKQIGLIGAEVEGKEVSCNVCSHKFKTVAMHQEVECPNCGHKSYVESGDCD